MNQKKIFSGKYGRIGRAMVVLVLDVLALVVSSFLALYVRFEFSINAIPVRYMEGALQYLPVYIGTVVLVYYIFRKLI